MELWKDIPNYEGYYQVSSLGKVKSLPRKFTIKKSRILIPRNFGRNYCHVWLSVDGVKKSFAIHRLVAQAFIPNPNNKTQVNHKDCNPENNKRENLEWCTAKENTNHALRNNRISKGEKHYKAKLTWDKIKEIRNKYINGITIHELAKEYQIGYGNTYHIVTYKTWKIIK